jgi:hypothetical protein
MSGPFDTDEWRLVMHADFKPINPPVFVKCERCNGTGEIGGHFKDLDGERTCPDCHGIRGHWRGGPSSEKPEVPRALIDHMRKAYLEYCASIKKD